MSAKSLLHYFKPKVTPADPVPDPVVVEVEDSDENEVAVETENVEDGVAENDKKPKRKKRIVESEESDAEAPATPSVRRSTRASATRAREAWNDKDDTSSDDDDDFVVGTRKRTRNSGSGRGTRQTTLGKNGMLISKKDKENNNSKKKPKLDPERLAFLRSGVPDVIEKAKKKSLEGSSDRKRNESEEDKVKETKKRQLDAETLAFLQSGVPESVLKAKVNVDKRREENDWLESMGFFPKTSHVCSNAEGPDDLLHSADAQKLGDVPFKISSEIACGSEEDTALPLMNSATAVNTDSQDFTCLSSQDSGILTPLGFCCDKNPIKVSISRDSLNKTRTSSSVANLATTEQNKTKVGRPWIDQMRVTAVKSLVVDTNALETLTRWLKRWKLDIKDDGGTSRKLEPKKKRGNSSDSDFITSDEEESEIKKKSVLLTGPSGCGKTAAVYVLAKHFDFEVVEVNFSSRRPGKEVLQRVEEAVLSHRLKSSHNCLLLFKDIDLLHPEEDEGFCSAVAQLITTAVRPIAMTSSLPSYCLIDSKLDRKDPLRISFSLPKPAEIVNKILKPILDSTESNLESDGSVDQIEVDRWLDSIVRHAGCDIRQSINQLQLLLSTSAAPSAITHLSNLDIHLYSSPFQPHLVDLNFPRQSLLPAAKEDRQEDGNEDEVNMKVSARKKRQIAQLDSVADSLELFADLDYISRLPSSLPTRNVDIFGDVEEAAWQWNHVSGMRSSYFTRLAYLLEAQQRKPKEAESQAGIGKQWIRELVLESDTEIDNWMEIDGLNDEIGQYCDSSAGGIDWQSCAAVRTIVKNNLLDGGRVQKRHGRMASYFNRLDKRLVGKIKDTLGFTETLNNVTVYS